MQSFTSVSKLVASLFSPHLSFCLYSCRWLHAPQPGGCDRMQLCGEGAGLWGFQGHTDGLYIVEEWSRRWGQDRWGAQSAQLRTLLLRLVFHWSQHGPKSQRTSPHPWRHYRQPLFLVRAWNDDCSTVLWGLAVQDLYLKIKSLVLWLKEMLCNLRWLTCKELVSYESVILQPCYLQLRCDN